MPENQRGLQRHKCSAMIRHQPRSVVGSGARRGNIRIISEPIDETDEALAAIQGMPRRGAAVLPFREELHTHGVGIEVVKKDLNLKKELPFLLFNYGAAKSQLWPVLCELRLPTEQFRSHRTLVYGPFLKGRRGRQVTCRPSRPESSAMQRLLLPHGST